MEFFLKNKIIIFRILGIIMLVVGFSVHFWVTPKEGFTKAQIAAANVARMEANVKGASSKGGSTNKVDENKYLEELKKTQEKQIRYLTIIAMIFGLGFLGYSFIKKSEPEI